MGVSLPPLAQKKRLALAALTHKCPTAQSSTVDFQPSRIQVYIIGLPPPASASPPNIFTKLPRLLLSTFQIHCNCLIEILLSYSFIAHSKTTSPFFRMTVSLASEAQRTPSSLLPCISRFFSCLCQCIRKALQTLCSSLCLFKPSLNKGPEAQIRGEGE